MSNVISCAGEDVRGTSLRFDPRWISPQYSWHAKKDVRGTSLRVIARLRNDALGGRKIRRIVVVVLPLTGIVMNVLAGAL